MTPEDYNYVYADGIDFETYTECYKKDARIEWSFPNSDNNVKMSIIQRSIEDAGWNWWFNSLLDKVVAYCPKHNKQLGVTEITHNDWGLI